MFDKVAHAWFTASNTVGFKQAHLRPAQAKTIADRVVDFFGCRNAVFDQPKRLAPDGLKETIRDMGVDFSLDVQRVHADLGQNILCLFNQFGRVLIGRDKLDQGQKIDRIKRMGDHDLLRARGTALQFRRLKSRCGRADNRVMGAMFLQGLIDLAL